MRNLGSIQIYRENNTIKLTLDYYPITDEIEVTGETLSEALESLHEQLEYRGE
jgi:hypothetical protein